MHKSSNSSSASLNTNYSNNNNYISQLRRLKIQENVLSANVIKSYCNVKECNVNMHYTNKHEVKTYLSRIKDLYQEIKNLFEDIKGKTNYDGNFEICDLNELKTDILCLESKIKSLKDFLRNELALLQEKEANILNTMNDYIKTDLKNIRCKKKQPSVVHYKEIVPSPVRAMINSPFKCTEVHQYQEFLKNSTNRCGGWNEYNHNIFIQIWNKYYKEDVVQSNFTENNIHFEEFKHEALNKISGIKSDDIITHAEWYQKYISLKAQQQNALNKWQENKRKIRKREEKPQKIDSASSTSTTAKISTNRCKDQNVAKSSNVYRQSQISSSDGSSSIESKGNQLIFLSRPTKQWINRCQGNKEKWETNLNIENISKLCTPSWRLSLQ